VRIVFIGTGDIGLPSLRTLLERGEIVGVVTQPDKPAGRRQELLASPVKALAAAHGIPVYQPTKIRADAAVEPIREWQPDLVVVMAYGQILPPELLQLPRRACLNLHASLLPRHRGAAPIQAAIVAGDRESGITVMHMDEGLDTGDVLLQKAVPIRRRETGGSLHERLAKLAPAALNEALILMAQNRAPRSPQDNALATYAPKLSRDDGKLNWGDSAETLERKVRAFNPWPAARTSLPLRDGEPHQLKVFSAIRCRRLSGAAGVVLRSDERGLLIAAGIGAVLLRDVQLAGKKRMPAGEFLRGFPVAPGTQLG
jgi:methionyl-tRNA formyltransferase